MNKFKIKHAAVYNIVSLYNMQENPSSTALIYSMRFQRTQGKHVEIHDIIYNRVI